MPSLVKEVTQGQSKSRERGAESGAQSTGSASRVFRVVLSSPGESFDEQQACGVSIGSAHPSEAGYICTSYTTSYDGDSRMVVLVTFNYQALSGDQDQPPDARAANWSISSTVFEKPVDSWRRRTGEFQWAVQWLPPTNAAGDMIDGVTKFAPMITITIQQFETADPTKHVTSVGYINEERIYLGSLRIDPHELMLRSVQSTPSVESFGDTEYRGWNVSYEFLYKSHTAYVHLDDGFQPPFVEVWLGWDIAVPQTGFNCIAYDPSVNDAASLHRDPFGQPLRHGAPDDPVFAGRIKDPLKLPVGVDPLEKVRSMAKVFSYNNEGATQTPSAQPIPLNDDGTPRKIDLEANPKKIPLVRAYQVYLDINFTETFKLRLF